MVVVDAAALAVAKAKRDSKRSKLFSGAAEPAGFPEVSSVQAGPRDPKDKGEGAEIRAVGSQAVTAPLRVERKTKKERVMEELVAARRKEVDKITEAIKDPSSQ